MNKQEILLPKRKKLAVQSGCVCIMLSISMYGLVFATLTSPILERIDALDYVSLFSILAALGVTIMTPVGGRLGDLIGRRNIVVIPGIVCAVCGVAFIFFQSLGALMFLRLLIALAQGTFTAAPFIIVGLIHEKNDVPKAMGMLATAIAVGGFGGSILAGILTDMGFLTVAILMPVVPLLLGIILIGINFPNVKHEAKVTIDIPGIITLVIVLCGFLLPMNFGSMIGWTNPLIVGGFIIGMIALWGFIKVENKAREPLIPLKLFKNKDYTILLLVGFLCYFYQNAMNVYAPIGALQVMRVSTALTGILQMPRTIVTIFLPTIAGVWVGKNINNSWKAMALAAVFAAFPMAMMAFTRPETSIMVYIVALTLTGIAESFRSVSITPAAQAKLDSKDIGVGTSLVNFVNSLSGTVAAAVSGVAYNMKTASNPTDVIQIQNGVNAVFRLTAVVSFLGLVLVIVFVRKANKHIFG